MVQGFKKTRGQNDLPVWKKSINKLFKREHCMVPLKILMFGNYDLFYWNFIEIFFQKVGLVAISVIWTCYWLPPVASTERETGPPPFTLYLVQLTGRKVYSYHY